MSTDTVPPLPGWRRQKNVRDILQVCQKCAEEGDVTQSMKALQSLHCLLQDLQMNKAKDLEHEMISVADDTIQTKEKVSSTAASSLNDDNMNNISAPSTESTQEDFLYQVAKELICLERVIESVDDEVECGGDHSLDNLDYKNRWYIDIMRSISQVNNRRSEYSAASKSTTNIFNTGKDIMSCDQTERWVDRCLDSCGYAISLEVAVECLRNIVSGSSSTMITSSNDVQQLNGERKTLGVAAAITSLRTIRRRLLLATTSTTSVSFDKSWPIAVPESYRGIGSLDARSLNQLFEYLILPLEYCNNNNPQNTILSESLSSISTSVLPTLVSSACHFIKIPLPSWAAPKISYGILFHSAWKIVLAGNLLDKATSPTAADTNNSSLIMTEVATKHFQMLVRRMIESGRTDIVVHHLYKCWKSCDADLCIRIILCQQFQSVLDAIPSKREVAILFRAIIRYCIKQEITMSQHAAVTGRLDAICKTNVLPFLQDLLLPSLSKDAGLADAVVHFIVLSPPASFQCRPASSSSQMYPTLRDIDRAAPRCLSQLLALVCDEGNESNGGESDSTDSEEECRHNISHENRLLSHLFTVASVWCEDVFIERSDILQQQYVTEFLVQPLESKQMTQNDLQRGLSNDGVPLATMLIQGVTLRLDVSRSESIRVDGMRVAEAMATLLGQRLRFDELHPAVDKSIVLQEEVSHKKEKKREKKKRNNTKRVPTNPKISVVDDDAPLLDESDFSDDCSQADSSSGSYKSESSNSSWGEDSLRPYSLDDDEEDLRRVPCPRTLRSCLDYLISTSENDDLAYEKHDAALSELKNNIIAARPLDFLDVISTLVPVLLFLEDKFSMDQFISKRWDSLMALGINAPLETCMILVGEMKGNISLGTRMDALTLLRCIAEELSCMRSGNQQPHETISNSSDQELVTCSTRLRLALNLHETDTNSDSEEKDANTKLLKTKRWRKPRTPATTTTNEFGPVSVQMIYSLFAFLSQTRTDETIWGGPIGEKFLSEFLKTLAIMLNCARAYPNPALHVLATDLFGLAWSFHDAKSADVRYSALLAIATIMPLLPLEFVMRNSQGITSFLDHSSALEKSLDCREMAKLVIGSLAECMKENMIIERA